MASLEKRISDLEQHREEAGRLLVLYPLVVDGPEELRRYLWRPVGREPVQLTEAEAKELRRHYDMTLIFDVGV